MYKQLISISLIALLAGCRQAGTPRCGYVASPVDLEIVSEGESLVGKGPSAFSVDGHFMWGASVLKSEEDGKYLLYFKGNIYDPHWRGVHGVALGDSPTGPFTPLDTVVFDLPSIDGQKLSAEDPYVWYNRKDHLFYAVFKDFTGHFTQSGPCLAIMYSEDGINWKLPKNSLFMKKELVLTSGDTVKVHRLERPQLLLDENDNPQVLYSACSVGDVNQKYDGSSLTCKSHCALLRSDRRSYCW